MDDNKQNVAAVLGLIMAAYPRNFEGNEEEKKATLRVYALALRDIDPNLLRAAALQHITLNKWFPTVAELRDSAAALIMDASGRPDAPTAWGEVAHQLRYVGRWGKPTFTDDLIVRAVEAVGGWHTLCASENAAADRARFIQAYNAYLSRQTEQLKMLPEVRAYVAEQTLQLGSGRDPRDEVTKQIGDLALRLKAG